MPSCEKSVSASIPTPFTVLALTSLILTAGWGCASPSGQEPAAEAIAETSVAVELPGCSRRHLL